MKVMTIFGAVLLLAGSGFLLFRGGMPAQPLHGSGEEGAEAARPDTVYYCPMHPEYKSNRPGECPICHMTLVPSKDEKPVGSSVPGYTEVTLSPERRQLIGVRSEAVERRSVVSSVRAAGIVQFNEKKISVVSLKLNGWAVELAVKAAGEHVREGTPLLYLYSPELLEAEKSYLLALQARRSFDGKQAASFADQTLKSARDRLLLLDISADHLRSLEGKKEPAPRTAIHSKVNGVVTKKNVVEGAYIQAGADLYEIADLSSVWVSALVHVSDIDRIKPGQQAQVALASRPVEKFPAVVDYVYPWVEEQTRTVRVRFEVPNPGEQLRPGDYAVISLDIPAGEQLVVDNQAVMDTGRRQLVFVDLGDGRFEPREVEVGARTGGITMILAGLREGEKVVTSSNFLLDSESRLKAALSEKAAAEPQHH